MNAGITTRDRGPSRASRRSQSREPPVAAGRRASTGRVAPACTDLVPRASKVPSASTARPRRRRRPHRRAGVRPPVVVGARARAGTARSIAFASSRTASADVEAGRAVGELDDRRVDGEARSEHDLFIGTRGRCQMKRTTNACCIAALGVGRRRPARSRRRARRPAGPAGSGAARPARPAASARAAAAHGADLGRQRRSSSAANASGQRRGPRAARRRARATASAQSGPSSAPSSASTRAREVERRRARPAGRRRTRAASTPSGSARSPPTSAIARAHDVGGVVAVGIARGSPSRSRARPCDARACVIGLHSTPPTTSARSASRPRYGPRCSDVGHRRVVHRDSCPRRSCGGRRAPRPSRARRRRVIVGEHTVGPVHITSTSAGSPAPSSARYGDGRVPTYSVGHSVSVASGARARSASSNHVASSAWRGASPGCIGMSSSSSRNHGTPASRSGCSLASSAARSASDS